MALRLPGASTAGGGGTTCGPPNTAVFPLLTRCLPELQRHEGGTRRSCASLLHATSIRRPALLLQCSMSALRHQFGTTLSTVTRYLCDRDRYCRRTFFS